MVAGDAWLKWVLGNVRRRRVVALLIIASIGVLPLFGALFEGTLTNRELQLDLARDWGYWACFVLQPALIAWTLEKYLHGFPAALKELVANGVLTKDTMPARAPEREKAQEVDAKRPWQIHLVTGAISVAATLGLFVAFVWETENRCMSLQDDHYSGLLVMPASVFLFWIIAAGFFRLLACHAALRMAFAGGVTVQPLHPDRCGGVEPLGRLSMKFNVCVLGLGVFSAVSVLSNHIRFEMGYDEPMNIVIYAAYFTASVTAFFWPLLAVHSGMKQAKKANAWRRLLRSPCLAIPPRLPQREGCPKETEEVSFGSAATEHRRARHCLLAFLELCLDARCETRAL